MKLGKIMVGAVIAALTAQSANAQSAAPLQLAPQGSWTADFGDDSCALRRSFSDGTTTVLFEMSQAAPGNTVQIAVASSSLGTRDKPPRAQFLPNDTPREAAFYRPFTTADGRKGVALDASLLAEDDRKRADQDQGFIWPAAARDARERAISGYSLAGSFDRDLILLTGSLHAPMEVMRTCLDDLLTRWGLDPVAHRTLTRPVVADFRLGWFVQMARLQGSLLDARSPSTVRARLLVDEAGTVTACRLLNLPPDTEKALEFCAEMEKRARFTPALDGTGQPIRSFYIWELTRIARQQF